MNDHSVNLVFADLTVTTVEAAYTPFVVPADGPEYKIPRASMPGALLPWMECDEET